MLNKQQLKNSLLFATPVLGRKISAYELVQAYQTAEKDDIPVQTGNANKVLTTDGTTLSWLRAGHMDTWNTAGRPSAPVAGRYGFNTQTNAFEIYNGSAWRTVATS
jgi:hypothetical protein